MFLEFWIEVKLLVKILTTSRKLWWSFMGLAMHSVLRILKHWILIIFLRNIFSDYVNYYFLIWLPYWNLFTDCCTYFWKGICLINSCSLTRWHWYGLFEKPLQITYQNIISLIHANRYADAFLRELSLAIQFRNVLVMLP